MQVYPNSRHVRSLDLLYMYIHTYIQCHTYYTYMRTHPTADGQYLASRLSKSITQESSKLKQLIQKYNSFPGDKRIEWSDVTDLTSDLWLQETDTPVPKDVRLNAIKHHYLTLRADEEVHLLQADMKATFAFVENNWQHLLTVVDQLKLQPGTKYKNGALHLLNMACLECEGLLLDLRSSYSQYIDLPPLPLERFCSHLLPHPIACNFPGKLLYLIMHYAWMLLLEVLLTHHVAVI